MCVCVCVCVSPGNIHEKFETKSVGYIFSKYISNTQCHQIPQSMLVSLFNGISTFMAYLMSKLSL